MPSCQAKLCGLAARTDGVGTARREERQQSMTVWEYQALRSRNQNILLDEEKSLDLSNFVDVWEAS